MGVLSEVPRSCIHESKAMGRDIKPVHPGEVLKDIWKDIGLTQGQFADTLGISRQTVARLLACDRKVSADMAHRLARALGTSPGMWMRLQEKYDLWEVEKKHKRQYSKIQLPQAKIRLLEELEDRGDIAKIRRRIRLAFGTTSLDQLKKELGSEEAD